MPTVNIAIDQPVLVEFATRPGLQQVALSPADLAGRSAEALDGAMNAVRQMARRVCDSIDTLADPPGQVQVEFGIKLDAAAGALIAKAGAEASINVKLTWQRQEGRREHRNP